MRTEDRLLKHPNEFAIYSLHHPISDRLKYVGKSTDVAGRQRSHTYRPKALDTSKNANWIRSLLKQGLKPVLKIIEDQTDGISSVEEMNDAEIYWIAYMRGMGHDLNNHLPGGEGVQHSEETRKKISKSRLGSSLNRTQCPKGHAYVGGNVYTYENKYGTMITECATCRKSDSKNYRKQNADVVRAKDKVRYELNKEYIRARERARYHRNKESKESK